MLYNFRSFAKTNCFPAAFTCVTYVLLDLQGWLSRARWILINKLEKQFDANNCGPFYHLLFKEYFQKQNYLCFLRS